jgi:hypothetical protein
MESKEGHMQTSHNLGQTCAAVATLGLYLLSIVSFNFCAENRGSRVLYNVGYSSASNHCSMKYCKNHHNKGINKWLKN